MVQMKISDCHGTCNNGAAYLIQDLIWIQTVMSESIQM